MPRMPQKKSQLQNFIERFKKPEIAKSEADILSCDFVVCVLASNPLVFPDNVFDFCCECGEEVQLRPHVPKGPKRICYGCAGDLEADGDEIQVMISQKTADEVAAYYRKKQ